MSSSTACSPALRMDPSLSHRARDSSVAMGVNLTKWNKLNTPKSQSRAVWKLGNRTRRDRSLRAVASDTSEDVKTRVAEAAAWIDAWRHKQTIKEHFDARDAAVLASQAAPSEGGAAERAKEAAEWIENWRRQGKQPQTDLDEWMQQQALWRQYKDRPQTAIDRVGMDDQTEQQALWRQYEKNPSTAQKRGELSADQLDKALNRQLSAKRVATWRMARKYPDTEQDPMAVQLAKSAAKAEEPAEEAGGEQSAADRAQEAQAWIDNWRAGGEQSAADRAQEAQAWIDNWRTKTAVSEEMHERAVEREKTWGRGTQEVQLDDGSTLFKF